MISRLPKLLKEMLLHRCTKKELCLRSIKIMKRKIFTAWSLGRRSRSTRSRTKNKANEQKKYYKNKNVLLKSSETSSVISKELGFTHKL